MKTLFTSLLVVAVALGAHSQASKTTKAAATAAVKTKKEAEEKAAAEKKRKEADVQAAAEKKRKEEAEKVAAAEKTRKEAEEKAAAEKKRKEAEEAAVKTKAAKKKAASTREATVDFATNAANTSTSNEVKIFQSIVSPNPMPAGAGKISIEGFNENGTISFTNTSGELVFSQAFQQGTATFELQQAGMYVYKVTNTTGQIISKGKFIVY